MIAKVTVSDHQQAATRVQGLRCLLKEPQGNVITHHTALVKRRIQKDQIERPCGLLNSVAVRENRRLPGTPVQRYAGHEHGLT